MIGSRCTEIWGARHSQFDGLERMAMLEGEIVDETFTPAGTTTDLRLVNCSKASTPMEINCGERVRETIDVDPEKD